MKKTTKHSTALVLALICALTMAPVTGCSSNTNAGADTTAEESTTAPQEETTNGTLPDTTSDTASDAAAQDRLTEDQAYEAFHYFMIEGLINLNSPVRRYWYREKTEGDVVTFWFTGNNLSFPTRLDMNLATGDTVASAYERKGADLTKIDDPGVSEYDFNAWDYLKNPPAINSAANAKDMKQYIGKNIKDITKEYADLEFKPDQNHTGWVNKDLMFDTYGQDKENVEYVRVSGGAEFSVYGIVPGMSSKDAISCAVIGGAGSMITGDPTTIDGDGTLYFFEMGDGNTLEVVLTKDGKVNYAGVISVSIKDKFVTDM